MKPAAEFILLADFAPMTFLNGVIWQSVLVGRENSMNVCCVCIITTRTVTFFHLKIHIRSKWYAAIIHTVPGDPSHALTTVFHMHPPDLLHSHHSHQCFLHHCCPHGL